MQIQMPIPNPDYVTNIYIQTESASRGNVVGISCLLSMYQVGQRKLPFLQFKSHYLQFHMAQPNKRNNRLECIKSSVKFKLLLFFNRYPQVTQCSSISVIIYVCSWGPLYVEGSLQAAHAAPCNRTNQWRQRCTQLVCQVQKAQFPVILGPA